MWHSIMLLVNIFLLFCPVSIKSSSYWKRSSISIQLNELEKKMTKESSDGWKSMDEYIDCVTKGLELKNQVRLMTGFQDIMNTVEKDYGVTISNASKVKTCFYNEKLISEGQLQNHTEHLCMKHRKSKYKGIDILHNRMTTKQSEIFLLFSDMFKHQLLTDILEEMNSGRWREKKTQKFS
ncbi:unnamed protein product [Schistosoma turkestanicum]|nr:unnamed protein product [Schistosoma turkestanicum]